MYVSRDDRKHNDILRGISTLSTDLSSNNRYVIGSTLIIMLDIDIYNCGKSVYQAKVRFIEVLMLASIPSECMKDSLRWTLDVICDVGDPLRTNIRQSSTCKMLTLQLDMNTVRNDVKEIKLQAHISTQSNEVNLDDNTCHHYESLYSYLHANKERTLNGIRFQHFYNVHFEVSPVERQKAVLTVIIPTHIWLPEK
ncbi:Integrin alpha-PS4 [Temnothorax longispinosus]|uniref:Integrin alpha-PS4 n=1 Tax=Temnothorax longispinosus TaxID=300112 RepID=A0A4S2JQ12_9HYME|nr:Integrin alpha-PS4 [Temnothorax longispinosus]